jgi:hypothetical protein
MMNGFVLKREREARMSGRPRDSQRSCASPETSPVWVMPRRTPDGMMGGKLSMGVARV